MCFSLCNACRGTLPVRVWIGPRTPRSLWAAAPCHQQKDGGNGRVSLRTDVLNRGAPLSPPPTRHHRRRVLLGVRATAVVWDRGMGDIPLAAKLLERVASLKFGFNFDEPLNLSGKIRFTWPDTLVALDLGVKFQQDLSDVSFPDGLRKLRLGAAFNRCIQRVAWPASLQQLTFGHRFNKPIDGVRWPAALKRLVFGDKFDQPLRDANNADGSIAWPPDLESLTFGADFSHKVGEGGSSGGVAAAAAGAGRGGGFGGGSHLPASLMRLTLSEGFQQHMDSVAWPSRLEELNLDCVYVSDAAPERSAAAAAAAAACLPAGLKRLRMDLNFHQSVQDVVPLLPEALQELSFGDRFNQRLDGVTRWPRLIKLAFGGSFNQAIEDGHASFPPELQQLRLGSSFNQPIVSVAWPASLQELTFSDQFNQPISSACWPEELRALEFGRAFNRPFSSYGKAVRWPKKLTRLRMGKNFRQSVDDFILPASLVELELAEGCQQELEGVAWPEGLKTVTVGVGRAAALVGGAGLALPGGCRIQRF